MIDTTGPGGAETVFVQLATGLDATRFTSFASVRGHGWVHDQLRKRGLDPILIPTNRSFDLPYLASLVRAARRCGADLIQSHLLGANVYSSLAGILTGTPVVTTFHGTVDVSARERFRRLKWQAIGHGSTETVFVSEFLRRTYLAEQPLRREKTSVIPNGVDCHLFRPGSDVALRRELGVRRDDTLVGAIGNLRPAKAYDVFLRAAACLRSISTRYKFVIVGGGEGLARDTLVRLRDRLGMREVVHLVGFREPVNELLQNLDVFLVTSESEGFSLATAQAMATEIPVVSTRCGGPEEIVSDGVTGLLVETDSPEQIAGAVERLTRDAELRQRLVRAARASVETRFSRDTMIERYEALYDGCYTRWRIRPRFRGRID